MQASWPWRNAVSAYLSDPYAHCLVVKNFSFVHGVVKLGIVIIFIQKSYVDVGHNSVEGGLVFSSLNLRKAEEMRQPGTDLKYTHM